MINGESENVRRQAANDRLDHLRHALELKELSDRITALEELYANNNE
jgi:hypothetical protein